MSNFENMNEFRIDSAEHFLYSSFSDLYRMSFPLYEQRQSANQLQALKDDRYHLLAWQEEGVFLGFIAYWQFKDYLYIEHYAINPLLRGKGLGTIFLKNILGKTKSVVILEIDPVIDHISAKRLDFYSALGFMVNEYSHIHPPYHEGIKGHALKVLSSRLLCTDIYHCFKHDLEKVVMDFPAIMAGD